MIKFVCATCAERLSVSEQFAGRKGACPSCGSINRVPLRGFVETQGSTPNRTAAAKQPAPRMSVPAQMESAGVESRNGTSQHNGTSIHGTSTNGTSTHGASANGTANHNGSNHYDHDLASATAVKVPFVDRRGRIEPAVQPTLPPARRTTLPPAATVRVEIPSPPAPSVQPAAKPQRPAPAAPAVQQAPARSNPAPANHASAVAPAHSANGSFLDAAVAAMPDHQPEDQVNIYAQRHTLAADQLTPGERWRQAFAAEDAQPSRLGRLLSWTGLSKPTGAAADSTLNASLNDESLPTAVKAGLLVVGVSCLAGAIYGVLHLMLWMSAGVK